MATTWKAIAAMAENRVIGAGGKIPWHFSEDLKFFKATTLGHTIVMGRKTWNSLGKPLPGRRNVVVSRSLPPGELSLPGAAVVPNLEAVKALPPQGDVWVIGGAEIYALALPRCAELVLTHVRGAPAGDVFFPVYENIFSPVETLQETADFRIVQYVNLALF